MSLKSYRVFNSRVGRQAMTIIVNDEYSIKELNDLLRSGMYVTVIDERSKLVKGVDYDVE